MQFDTKTEVITNFTKKTKKVLDKEDVGWYTKTRRLRGQPKIRPLNQALDIEN